MEFGSLPLRPRRAPGGGSGGQPADVDALAATLGRPGRAAGVVAGELAAGRSCIVNMWDLTQCAYDDDYDGTWDRYGPVEMIDTGWCWLNF